MSFSERFKRGARAVARFVGLLGAPVEADGATTPPAEPDEVAKERAVLATLSRCTVCGACDVAFPYDSVARPAFRGPSDAIAYGRALSDHGALGEFVKNLHRGDLEKLEHVCPVSIPFVALADVLARRAERFEPPPRLEPEKAPRRPRHEPG